MTKPTELTQNAEPLTGADGYLTKRELAARLRMKPRTVERWMKHGYIPYIKLGDARRNTVLFKWADVDAHLNERFRRVGGGR